MVFLAAVVAASATWGLRVALFTSVLSFLVWNFFFIPPLYQLTIDEPRDVVAILLFLGVGGACGALGQPRAQGGAARRAAAWRGCAASVRSAAAWASRPPSPRCWRRSPARPLASPELRW